jgi:hypothetical protein
MAYFPKQSIDSTMQNLSKSQQPFFLFFFFLQQWKSGLKVYIELQGTPSSKNNLEKKG